jgi:hypothetical protein
MQNEPHHQDGSSFCNGVPSKGRHPSRMIITGTAYGCLEDTEIFQKW